MPGTHEDENVRNNIVFIGLFVAVFTDHNTELAIERLEQVGNYVQS